MAIIVEGPDNSGKTTLVNYLSDKLCLPAFHAGGPPKDDEVRSLLIKQCKLSKTMCIMDRVTCISRQVYQRLLDNVQLQSYLKSLSSDTDSVIIYCRPPNHIVLDMDNHVIRDDESSEHIKFINDNQKEFVDSYDKLMSRTAHIQYNWSDSTSENLIALAEYLYITINRG